MWCNPDEAKSTVLFDIESGLRLIRYYTPATRHTLHLPPPGGAWSKQSAPPGVVSVCALLLSSMNSRTAAASSILATKHVVCARAPFSHHKMAAPSNFIELLEDATNKAR